VGSCLDEQMTLYSFCRVLVIFKVQSYNLLNVKTISYYFHRAANHFGVRNYNLQQPTLLGLISSIP
jgi:hypothetical protein